MSNLLQGANVVKLFATSKGKLDRWSLTGILAKSIAGQYQAQNTF
jgi:hypothetical protein